MDLDITFTRDPGELEALHCEIEKVRLANKHGAAFADDAYVACWQEVYGRLARSDRLEAGTLRLDGRLAAYVLVIPDQRAYRVIAGHHDSTLDAYRPGRLLETETVLLARSRGYALVDWTSAVAPLRRSGMPGIIGSTGWEWSSAWVPDFSSTHSTTASSGGL